MLALVAMLAWGHDPVVSQALLDPGVWWYAARASGLLAWVLLSVSVVGGLLMGTRLTRGSARLWTQGLHEFVGALAVVFTAIHLVSVFSDSQLRIGVAELLVPFARSTNPVAQGCGVIAFYLLTAVVLTSWVRVVLPWRCWRRVHLLALPLWGLASVHTVLAGSDITEPTVHWAGVAVAVAVAFLTVLRLVTARRAGAAAAPAMGQGPAAVEGPPQDAGPAASPAVTAPMMASVATGLQLLIGQTTWEADNVLSLRLDSPDGTALPNWEPGAHIEVALPSGRRRQYSLYGDPADTRSYRIAVLQVPTGRGGSVEVHAGTRAGQLITVHGPRNHFPLITGPAYLFIAGGIGITAMMAMATRVAATGGEWKLVYIGRRRASMAFINEVCALSADRIDIVPGDERGRPDLRSIIGAAVPGTAVYCCGPDQLLRAVQEQVAARSDLGLHSERFTGTAPGAGAAFQVELRRSQRVIDVPANRTVLQAVRDVVPAISAGCEQGVCGACRTTILAGEPDHRDELLSNADRAAGAILICVSRAHTEKLTLDL
jgi:ferredoxin-NADP reductase/DMSO/TMAO reductase YedYZ heme-binding membrane subunit